MSWACTSSPRTRRWACRRSRASSYAISTGRRCAGFAAFDQDLHPAAVGEAVFDHGAAPPGVSDRQFRFDYLEARIRHTNRLSAFAYRAGEVPESLSRLRAVVESAGELDAPLVVMDTAPAAVLGALLDPRLQAPPRQMVVNIGNFHTLAFRLGPVGIEGAFEHHTGLLTQARLEAYLRAFADGNLTHQAVFGDMGHGALVLEAAPLPLETDTSLLAVTGPRRSLLEGSSLRPYFAAPLGDMMLAGCFGLLQAMGELLPEPASAIHACLEGESADRAPWDAEGSGARTPFGPEPWPARPPIARRAGRLYTLLPSPVTFRTPRPF